MKTPPIYKTRQEGLLIEELVASSMISQAQLYDIKKHYDENVPYHNFLHALTVAEKVLELSSEEYNIIEIRSLFLAGLFHDAGHSGMAEDLDEFRSLDIAFTSIEKFEKKYNYGGIDFTIVRQAIIGTVFKNRGKNKNKYAILMADLDIHGLGGSFCDFLYYSDFGMALEIGEKNDGIIDIKKWFKNINYFKFIMGINKNIYLSQNIQNTLLCQSLYNITQYINIEKNNYTIYSETHKKKFDISELFRYWKNNDITLEEFRKKFF